MKPRVTIYCDGACAPNPGIGGWAAVLISANGRRLELSGAEPAATSSRMELTGAIMGLRALKRPCQVDVHTDSKYVCNAFVKGWLDRWTASEWRTSDRKRVVNQDLWRGLLELRAVHDIAWHWVRGHGDCVENNRCDELAVAARVALRDERA